MPIDFKTMDDLRAYDRQVNPNGEAPARDDALLLATEINRAVLRHPLFIRYVNHLHTVARNTLPWHALGERLYATASLAQAAMGVSGISVDGIRFGLDTQACVAACLQLATATPYLWRDHIQELVLQSPDLPPHTISRDILPYPHLFFSGESCCQLFHTRPDGTTDRTTHGESNWFALFDVGDGIACWTDEIQPGTGELILHGSRLNYGLRYPDDFDAQYLPATSFLLRRLAFLNSPYIDFDRGHLPRPIRRDLQRSGVQAEALDEEVYVVQLRRRRQEEADAHPPEDVTLAPDWKHHWWVSGHYRAQWYPSEGAHHVIYVAPYIKGDLEKPLLEKVYHVRR